MIIFDSYRWRFQPWSRFSNLFNTHTSVKEPLEVTLIDWHWGDIEVTMRWHCGDIDDLTTFSDFDWLTLRWHWGDIEVTLRWHWGDIAVTLRWHWGDIDDLTTIFKRWRNLVMAGNPKKIKWETVRRSKKPNLKIWSMPFNKLLGPFDQNLFLGGELSLCSKTLLHRRQRWLLNT